MTQIDIHDPEPIDVLGAKMLVVARMGDGDDDTVLIRSAMSAEPRLVPLHAHADIESFYVLDGRLDVYVDDGSPGWRTIGPGQSLTVPGNVRHAVRNASGAPIDSILATTARVARFFGEIARAPGTAAQATPTPEEMAKIKHAADAYGYWLASPEENAVALRLTPPAAP